MSVKIGSNNKVEKEVVDISDDDTEDESEEDDEDNEESENESEDEESEDETEEEDESEDDEIEQIELNHKKRKLSDHKPETGKSETAKAKPKKTNASKKTGESKESKSSKTKSKSNSKTKSKITPTTTIDLMIENIEKKDYKYGPLKLFRKIVKYAHSYLVAATDMKKTDTKKKFSTELWDLKARELWFPFFSYLDKTHDCLPDIVILDLLKQSLKIECLTAYIFTALHFPINILKYHWLDHLWEFNNILAPCSTKTQLTLTSNIATAISDLCQNPEAIKAYGKDAIILQLLGRVPSSQLYAQQHDIQNLKPATIAKLIKAEDFQQLMGRVDFNFGLLIEMIEETSNKNFSLGHIAPLLLHQANQTYHNFIDTPFDYHLPSATNVGYKYSSYQQLKRLTIKPLYSQPTDKHERSIQSDEMQRILAVIHKAPSLIQTAFAAKTLNLLKFVELFEAKNWHVIVQLLMIPSTPIAPCSCLILKLQQSTYGDSYRLTSFFERSHVNNEETTFSVVRHGSCKPWYRPNSCSIKQQHNSLFYKEQGNWAAAILKEKMTHRFSLINAGRMVACCHFLILFAIKGVQATTALTAGDVVLRWANDKLRPNEKVVRKIFTLARDLDIPKPTVAANATHFINYDSKQAVISNFLKQQHLKLLKDEMTPSNKILMEIYQAFAI